MEAECLLSLSRIAAVVGHAGPQFFLKCPKEARACPTLPGQEFPASVISLQLKMHPLSGAFLVVTIARLCHGLFESGEVTRTSLRP